MYYFAQAHKNITWFFKTLGENSYEMRIEIESLEKYQKVIKEIRNNFFDIIEELETITIFKEIKEDYSSVL